jgi:hypothetical protein
LYDNLSATIGLAVTTGKIEIDMTRTENGTTRTAAQIISANLSEKLANETDALSAALRQNVYEQMFLKAPERFLESELRRRDPAANSTYRALPFQPGDTIAFLTTFKFPAEKIFSPAILNALRSGLLTIPVGDKITVATTSLTPDLGNPAFDDFPDATVLVRIKLGH